MRYAILGVVVVTVVCLNARVAGGMVRVPLWDGMFSFVTPKGWWVSLTDNLLTTHAAPTPGALSRILFTTPNPFFEGDASEFLQAQLSLYADNTGVELETMDGEQAVIDGFDSHCCTFAMQAGDRNFLGAAFAFDFSGCKVFAMAVALEDEYELYQDVFTEIICSYETDDAKLAAYQERLLASARQTWPKAAAEG